MRQPKIIWLLCITLFVYVEAQATFEDADKANEYTNQNFDLRHTIPGEPGVDYPILSAVPKTSFTCKGRHEGYYADVESRCQAFRICAHTARSAHGFGFLCPNGTLFNQQHFVCDWYRNVKCDEAESYYDMNAASRVGSTKDMMETVRQMMEYPMKTISKALQKLPGTSPKTNHPSQAYEQLETNSDGVKPIVHAERTVGRKAAVTRAQVESVKSYGESERGEAIKSEQIAGEAGDDVYVNSLGELSSDPGIKFDHTNAHIVAEYPREHHYHQQMNFAESVNAGLKEEETGLPVNAAMAPDYIKRIRMTKDEATQLDLVSNINSLLEEVSTDLDTSVSGYQTMNPQVKIKQPFRFLSRGFSMHDKQSPYQYTKPKQTESTIRFTPNDIPIDTQKDTTYYTQKHNFEKTAVPAELVENELVLTTPEVPVQIFFEDSFDESTTLLPTVLENDDRTEPTTTEAQTSALPAIADTTVPAQQEPTSSSVPNNEVASLALPLNEFVETTANETPIDPERIDVNQRAANLLLAGVKLTSHNEHKRLNTLEPSHVQQLDLNTVRPWVSDATTEQSVASSVSTTPMSTSTETITEINSIQERIRGYRRFAHQQRHTAPASTSAAPQIYARRANVRPLNRGLATRTTTAKTTSTTTTAKPTLSYLQRVAASRLRLSRLSAVKNAATSSSTAIPVPTTTTITTTTTSTTSTTTPLPVQADQYGPNKKLSVRNIDKDTSNFNSLTDNGAKRGAATWESVHNNLQRYQVNRNRGTRPTTIGSATTATTTTTTTSTASTPTVRNSLQRNRNRFSNFKTQNTRTRGSITYADAIPTTATATITSTTSITPTTTKPPTVSAQLSLARQLSSLTASLHETTPYTYTTTTAAPLVATAATYTYTPNAVHIDNPSLFTNTNINTNTVTAKRSQTGSDNGSASSASYLSFDKLTRAIVDNSILQNFKSNPQAANVRSSSAYQTVTSNVQQKPATAIASSNNAYSLGKQQITAAAAPVPRPQDQQKPAIVIARAEGQRIQSNSVNNIIASLATQPQTKATPSSSYVSLGDFLHTKFGNDKSNPTVATTVTANAYGNPQSQQQQQQQQHRQPTAQQQQQLSFITQRYQQQQNKQPATQQQSQIVQQQQLKPQKSIEQQVTHQQFYQQQQHVTPQQQYQQQQQYVAPQQQFQQQKHLAQTQFYQQQQPDSTQQRQQLIYQSIAATANQVNPFLQPTLSQQIYHNQPNQQQQSDKQTIHSIQQPYLTPNIFINYQQHQQQLPQFPPLTQTPQTSTQVSKTYVNNNNNNADYLNIQLPTLGNGLIPAPTLQVSQRRSDNVIGQLNAPVTSSTTGRARAFYAGATSYDVGQSSVGRLPNDITNLLRRRLRRY